MFQRFYYVWSSLFVVLNILASGPLLAAPKIGASGYLLRGTADRVYLNITVNNIRKADLLDKSNYVLGPRDFIYHRLAIKLQNHQVPDQRIKYEGETVSEAEKANILPDYTVEFYGPQPTLERTNETSDVSTLTIDVVVNYRGDPNSVDALSELVKDKMIAVNIEYKDFNDATTVITYLVPKLAGVANTSPAEFRLTGIHLGLNATWKAATEIPYIGDLTQHSPLGVNVFVVRDAIVGDLWGENGLEAKVFNEDEAKETPTTCGLNITGVEDDDICVICDRDANIYLDSDAIRKAGHPGITILEEPPSSTSSSIGQLVKGEKYTVFLTYKPDGVKVTTCKKIIITENFNLSELTNQDAISRPGNPACFIATAAYGTAVHPHLDLLRWFRDHYLLPTSLGNSFVDAYYHFSPAVAEYIATHPTFRTITQKLLWLPVLTIKALKNFPMLSVGVGYILLCSFLFLFMAVITRKTLSRS